MLSSTFVTILSCFLLFFFFFNDTATTEIYTLSLHDALPIFMIIPMLCVTIFVILVVWFLLPRVARLMIHTPTAITKIVDRKSGSAGMPRPISYAVFCLKKKKKNYHRTP